MDFLARPEAIEAFGDQVTGFAGDVGVAKGYIEQHLSIDGGETGMFSLSVGPAVNDVKNAVLASLNQLEMICRGSGEELRKSAPMYRNADQAEAGRLDASYPVPR